MNLKPSIMSQFNNCLRVRRTLVCSTTTIVGIFQSNQTCNRLVRIIRADRPADFSKR